MKKPRVFIDTDVLLDLLLQRKPFYIEAAHVLSLCEEKSILGFSSSLILANIYYIIRRLKDKKTAILSVKKLRELLTILSVGDREIGESLNSKFSDFEDGIQFYTALRYKVDYFMTRNIRDFREASLPALNPQQFLILYDKNDH